MQNRILTVFGTRPEAIKMISVVKKLIDDDAFEIKVCLTGQHREMIDHLMKIFDIKIDYDLNVMVKNQTLTNINRKVLIGMEEIFAQWTPDCILVQGDTTTAFSAALAAFYHKIDIGHIEAGLRTHNRYSPYPEEINRCLISELSSMHFAPTERSRQNLLKENFDDQQIFVTGNTLIDTLFETLEYTDNNKALREKLEQQFQFLNPTKRLILVTSHRRENHGDGLSSICQAIHTLSLRDDVQVVYPVHLNPNVRKPVYEILRDSKNVHLIEPLDYLEFISLMRKSYLILTDSGGIQEEAPSLGKPVLVMRSTTERTEAIDAGTALLVGTDFNAIVQNATRLLDEKSTYEKMAQIYNPYGDGKAAEHIIEVLKKRWITL